MGEPIKPIDAGSVPGIARAFFGGRVPRDVTIIGAYECAGCHRPHIVGLASSALSPQAVLAVLALAVSDVIDTYRLAEDDHKAPEYGRHNAES